MKSCYVVSEMVVVGALAFDQLQLLIVEHMQFLKALKIEDSVVWKLKCAKIQGNITLHIYSDMLGRTFSKFSDHVFPKLNFTKQAKEVISEEKTEPEITEIQKGISGNQLEFGQSSSSRASGNNWK